MFALLSPAKSLDFASAVPIPDVSAPFLSAQAAELAEAAAELSALQLAKLMHISPKLAELNAQRYANFGEQPQRPALFAFAGDVYTGFDAYSLDEPGIHFAQSSVRILSGLYGLLRPLDEIRPYRLEMGTRWAPGHKKLTDWWGGQIAERLLNEMAERESRTVLNLASNEYYAAVSGKLPGTRIIEVEFREPGPDGPRFVSFHAKRARGLMARYMCEHHITDPDAMRGFDSDGYRFDASESDTNRWRFTRA